VGGLRATIDAARAIVRRDASLFASYRLRFAAQALAALFSVSLFFYVSKLVRVEPFPTPGAYFGYVIVGLVVLELLTALLATTPAAVRQELVAGTFERMVVSPLGPALGVLAMTLFPAVLALSVGLLTITLGVAFGLDLTWPDAALAPPAAALITLAFLPLALVVAAAVLVAKQAGSAATFLVTGLSLTSGAFFPVGLLPGWVSWVSQIQPLTPALDLMRGLLIDGPVRDGEWTAALKLGGFATVMLPLSLLVLATVVELGRRRGTLTEY
jgi:ABC-type multidrug transport system permease subunit